MKFKTWLTIAKKIVGTIILVAVIVFLVKVTIEGKYIPFLGNFAQFLLDKFLSVLDSLRNWLVK